MVGRPRQNRYVETRVEWAGHHTRLSSTEGSGVFPLANNRSVPGWRRCYAIGLSCLLTLVANVGLYAQYRATQWTADNGLPQNSVRGIVQASDGYIWVATLNGVAKFDGIRFKVFDKSNTKGLSTNRFTSLYEDRDGTL